ncbi:XdhC family protein [Candidatus Oscillochloris fontis]|uniref:XdhC family protein n=1 Tax=Candidatus Oscillochloris fontis TaxID=2496868 RepID=UPI00101CF19F|nr:XdhC/CoxI family protein [Candidatus Oscillochloris fontis]
MQELIPHIDDWLARGEAIASATVVRTMGSSPRPVGAKLIVSSAQSLAGSVSGGCVEGAVIEACQTSLVNDQPRLLHIGVADEDAWALGLACGGEIDILVEPLTHYAAIRHALTTEYPIATATRITGPHLGRKLLITPAGIAHGNLGDPTLEQRVSRDAQTLLTHAITKVVEYPDLACSFLIESFAPAPRLFLIGAVHIAISLDTLAQVLGFHTVIVDPRASFANRERFPHAHELLVAWPDEVLPGRLDARSCLAVLTHDPKLDDPALRVALDSPARYIGALGSNKTHTKRLARLRQEGFTEDQLARIYAPIGMPLGGKRPEEIALSILAQIVKVQQERC